MKNCSFGTNHIFTLMMSNTNANASNGNTYTNWVNLTFAELWIISISFFVLGQLKRGKNGWFHSKTKSFNFHQKLLRREWIIFEKLHFKVKTTGATFWILRIPMSDCAECRSGSSPLPKIGEVNTENSLSAKLWRHTKTFSKYNLNYITARPSESDRQRTSSAKWRFQFKMSHKLELVKQITSGHGLMTVPMM